MAPSWTAFPIKAWSSGTPNTRGSRRGGDFSATECSKPSFDGWKGRGQPTRTRPRPAPAPAEPPRLERQGRHDREGVVEFEHVDVARPDSGLAIGGGRRTLD